MKKKKFSKVKAVKELSRERVGPVPVSKVLPHKNKKGSKHPKRDMELENG